MSWHVALSLRVIWVCTAACHHLRVSHSRRAPPPPNTVFTREDDNYERR